MLEELTQFSARYLQGMWWLLPVAFVAMCAVVLPDVSSANAKKVAPAMLMVVAAAFAAGGALFPFDGPVGTVVMGSAASSALLMAITHTCLLRENRNRRFRFPRA